MKMLLAASLLALASIGCAKSIDNTEAPRIDPDNYRLMEVSDIAFAEAEDLGGAAERLERYLGIGNEVPEGKYSQHTEIKGIDGSEWSKILIDEHYLPDDSVKSRELLALVKEVDGKIALQEVGMRFKCWRGSDTENWTIELCP